ncbi:hypothetical protein KJ359_011866 [Pestalotiopsis sp. 9143b]|nr:hypothetical protein KJ359_011866 [Pestalotiopsis sp. 9143b]
MSDLDVATPRVFLAPHGLTGLSLTSAGLAQVPGTAAQLVGPKKLIDPARVARVWVRPRRRAQQTFEILFGDDKAVSEKTVTTEDIAEWHYGDYEGLWTAEIKASRAERGLDKERAWDVCRDGCEGGEYVFCCPSSVSLNIMLAECDRSADQVSARLDKLISEIRNVQRPGFNGEGPCDVVLVRPS